MNPTTTDADRTPLWKTVTAAAGEVGRLEPGLGVGRYRLDRIVGEGTYGRVYLARQEVLGRKVAVKVLNRRHGSKKQEIRAFLMEISILSGLSHPGIVPVYDAGWTDDGFFYIVSRFIEGGDLGGLSARCRLGHAESARVAAEIAEALHYAHARGLVHRDIKPANVLIDPPLRPLLADFGEALRDRDYGRGSPLVGTPPYMSPEQARGEANRVDGRSDIFSLGVILYELLTGMRPFRGKTQREVLEQVVRAQVPSPCEVDAGVPEPLGRICLKALARRPSQRFATAEDMAGALREWLGQAAREVALVFVPAADGTLADSSIRLTTWGVPSTDADADLDPPGAETSLTAVGFRGLQPYGPRDAGHFLGMLPGPRVAGGLPECVEFWRSRIEGPGGEDSFRVGLLFGPAGCGKTSLLRAGLLPALSPRIIPIYIESDAEATEGLLLRRLMEACPGLPASGSLAVALTSARKGAAGKKVLVVLDQLERWLHTARLGSDTGLLAALRQCDGEHVQALAAVRDDGWSRASRFLRALGERIVEGANARAIDPLDRRHARKVLEALGRASGGLPREGPLAAGQERFLEEVIALLDDGDGVLPILLALLVGALRGRDWGRDGLPEAARLGDLAAAYVERALEGDSTPEWQAQRVAVRAVLSALLPAPGSGPGRDERGRPGAVLLEASGYAEQPERFAELMRRLADDELGLIAPAPPGLGPVASGGEALRYRLARDELIGPLRRWLVREEEATRPAAVVAMDAPPQRVGLNGATEEELRTLPGVGPVLARRIIAARPFAQVEDLRAVRGIGERGLRALRDLVALD